MDFAQTLLMFILVTMTAVLGFVAKMTYDMRYDLRKLCGRVKSIETEVEEVREDLAAHRLLDHAG